MPSVLPLTVSCFSKIQIGFTFLTPAHPGSLGNRAVKRVCVCVRVCVCNILATDEHYNWTYYCLFVYIFVSKYMVGTTSSENF